MPISALGLLTSALLFTGYSKFLNQLIQRWAADSQARWTLR